MRCANKLAVNSRTALGPCSLRRRHKHVQVKPCTGPQTRVADYSGQTRRMLISLIMSVRIFAGGCVSFPCLEA